MLSLFLTSYILIDDRLYSTILCSLEQTHCACMWFYMSDQLYSAFFEYPPKWCTYSDGMAGATWNCSRLSASLVYTIQPCSVSLHAKPHTYMAAASSVFRLPLGTGSLCDAIFLWKFVHFQLAITLLNYHKMKYNLWVLVNWPLIFNLLAFWGSVWVFKNNKNTANHRPVHVFHCRKHLPSEQRKHGSVLSA